MKKNFVNGLTVVALTAVLATGCSRDSGVFVPSEQEALEHANEMLGVEIDPSQDWKMATNLTATVTVNLGIDEKYTVAIMNENPLFNKEAVYYYKTDVTDGGTFTATFTVPSALETFYVAVYDSHKRALVKSAQVTGDLLNVDFELASASHTRATESEAPTYARTLADYLNPDLEIIKESLRQTTSFAWMADQVVMSSEEVTVAAMQEYTPFTDADLYENHNTLSNLYYFNVYDDEGNYLYNTSAYIQNGDGKHYRIEEGVEVNNVFHINGENNVVNDCVIYVEGTLHLNDNTLNGVMIVVGSTGHVIIDGDTSMRNFGRFVVMAGGQVTGASGVSFLVANGAPCFNAGTINFDGLLNINGSKFYNNGTVVVDELRNTSGGFITNFGSITARTNLGAADAYNCKFANACYLHYTESAGIGQITMLEGSRLDVDGWCEFSQSWQDINNIHSPNILMNNSVINVGVAYVTNTMFQGPSAAGEVAIVKMGAVQVGNGDDIHQSENCFFDWDVTKIYKKDGGAGVISDNYLIVGDEPERANNYVKTHVTQFITEASSMVSIPAGDCTGSGYNPGGGGGDDPTPAFWSYAFEDTPLGDYDMNDVVIRVNVNAEDENMLDVTLCCTGASLDLKVYLNESALFGGLEVHEVFGAARGSFVNTGVGEDYEFVTSTVEKPEGFDFLTADFWIDSPVVKGGVHIAKSGQDPHGIMVPGDWKWPLEYVRITRAYPHFVEFARDAATTDPIVKKWYVETEGNPVPNLVYHWEENIED